MAATDVLVWGLAGYALLLVWLQLTPVNVPRLAFPPFLLGLAWLAHLIPMPWVAYVAASGLIPVAFKLSGGMSGEETYGQLLRSRYFAAQLSRERKARARPPSKPGSRIPPL